MRVDDLSVDVWFECPKVCVDSPNVVTAHASARPQQDDVTSAGIANADMRSE